VKLTLQFHADRHELISWIGAWVGDLGLYVALHPLGPNLPVVAADRVEEEGLAMPEGIRQVSLSRYPLGSSLGSPLEFLDANPHVLTVLLGQQGPRYLRESVMGANTEDEESLACWKDIKKRVQRLMLRGATVTDPASGTQKTYKNHYYSQGALELSRSGVKMLAVAGWIEYTLGTGEGAADR
jgi:hypothetical protein